jgi:FkbM family methyltransferase
MCVIDIGAHIGLFSVCFSQLAGPNGKIICFEPTPGTFSILKDTLRLNHCDNVTALQAAVGSAAGTATFYVSTVLKGCNANSLVLNKDKKEAKGYDVTISTVDLICQQYNVKPGLIKVDVEGAELDVLKGSSSTMKTIRPFFILGLHPVPIAMKGDSLKEIWDLIKDHKYKVMYNESEMSEADFISQPVIFDVRLFPA